MNITYDAIENPNQQQ